MTEVGTWQVQNRLYGRPRAVASPGLDVSPGLALARAVAWRLMLVSLGCFAALMAVAVLPSVFGYPTLAVQGGSMGSSLPRGSVAIARWVPAEEVQLGYVIVVDGARANPKVHRVVSLDDKDGKIVARTKGDANTAADPGELVLDGRVAVQTYAIPFLGYGADFARTPLGWTLLVLLPAFVLALLTLRDIWVEETPAKAVPVAVT